MRNFKILFILMILLSFFNISVYACDTAAQKNTTQLINTYYDALNKKDMNLFLSIMDKNVVHDINQGPTEIGVEKFKIFMQKINDSFNEKLTDIVIMVSPDGKHAAAQWVDHGVYFKDFPSMNVHAKNQKYTLNGGHFFEIRDGKLSHVTTYYNESAFDAQVK